MSSLARYLDPQVIQQVRRLDLRARFIVEGFRAGRHRSPFQGLSIEFAEHRKYVQGDDLRTLDWNVFARTDRLYVRKYQAETHLACHLLVDTSASMGYVGVQSAAKHDQPPAKLMYAVHVAAALGFLITEQQDAVGLGLLGEGLEHFLPARSRQTHLVQMLGELSAVKPSGRTGLANAVHEALNRIPHRGVIVLLSDLLTETDAVLQALHNVRFRGHDLIVMHILDEAEAHFPFTGAVRLQDPETGEMLVVEADGVRENYLRGVREWREQLKHRIAGIRGDYVPLDTSMPFDKALIEFLTQRARRR